MNRALLDPTPFDIPLATSLAARILESLFRANIQFSTKREIHPDSRRRIA
jgi:hypothetical protein